MKKKINFVEIPDLDNALISNNEYNVNDENIVRGRCYSSRIPLSVLLSFNMLKYNMISKQILISMHHESKLEYSPGNHIK